MTIKVAVIGADRVGREHALRVSRDIVGAELSVLADADALGAEAIADEIEAWYGRRPIVTTDALAAVRHEETDAVLVASHGSLHIELVLAAISRGVPIFCDDASAPTIEEYRELTIREAATLAAGKTPLVSVGFRRRFDERCQSLRQEVRNGRHGLAIMARCLHRTSEPRHDAIEACFTNSTFHEFDFLPWLLDSPIAEVAWMAGHSSTRPAWQTPQLLLLRTDSGVLVTLETFASMASGHEVSCEVVFERGTARFRDDALPGVRGARRTGHSFQADALEPHGDAHRSEVQTWIEHLESGRPRGEPLANA